MAEQTDVTFLVEQTGVVLVVQSVGVLVRTVGSNVVALASLADVTVEDYFTVNGELVVNPNAEQRKVSDLELTVAASMMISGLMIP